MSRAAEVLDACRARGWHVATAESCTGGLIMGALTDVAGSSDVVERGFVTYSNAAKIEMLGVRPETLDAVGAVSEDVARQMAEGALNRSPADIAVSVTGIAGPGGSAFKPEGLVWFGLAARGRPALTLRREFGAIGRAHVRASSVEQALDLLLAAARDQRLP
ncbi:CinA family protein [Halovulum dunhuangense]|uniref:CinA family protein n=1 Tax=Halovulum dunhuangense TaxID=1505036 RepID=A0A849L346_9RHOB|nr:CinA family protein [Halovulum dunhuangense]NNU80642.1 CinA family protein [Halovulum dunhuangense]